VRLRCEGCEWQLVRIGASAREGHNEALPGGYGQRQAGIREWFSKEPEAFENRAPVVSRDSAPSHCLYASAPQRDCPAPDTSPRPSRRGSSRQVLSLSPSPSSLHRRFRAMAEHAKSVTAMCPSSHPPFSTAHQRKLNALVHIQRHLSPKA